MKHSQCTAAPCDTVQAPFPFDLLILQMTKEKRKHSEHSFTIRRVLWSAHFPFQMFHDTRPRSKNGRGFIARKDFFASGSEGFKSSPGGHPHYKYRVPNDFLPSVDCPITFLHRSYYPQQLSCTEDQWASPDPKTKPITSLHPETREQMSEVFF